MFIRMFFCLLFLSIGARAIPESPIAQQSSHGTEIFDLACEELERLKSTISNDDFNDLHSIFMLPQKIESATKKIENADNRYYKSLKLAQAGFSVSFLWALMLFLPDITGFPHSYQQQEFLESYDFTIGAAAIGFSGLGFSGVLSMIANTIAGCWHKKSIREIELKQEEISARFQQLRIFLDHLSDHDYANLKRYFSESVYYCQP